jgi:hypothetical protein
MSRLWLSLAAVFCLTTQALAADEPGKVPQWFPAAMQPPAVVRADASLAPAVEAPRSVPQPAMIAPRSRPLTPEKSGPPRSTRMFRTKYVSVNQLANTINSVFSARQQAGQMERTPNLAIVPDVASNTLIVSGSTEMINEVATFVQALDCPPTADSNGQRHTRCVLPLKNSPATQLAQTITKLFATEQQQQQQTGRFELAAYTAIVPDTVSNCLIVSGSAEAVNEVKSMVAQLDRAAMMVRLDVVLGDVPMASAPVAGAGAKATATKLLTNPADAKDLRKQMEVLFEAQLTTLDNQPACLKASRVEPSISSVSMSPMLSPSSRQSRLTPEQLQQIQMQQQQMQRTNSVTMQNVGTVLSLTPRVNVDGVVTMQLDINDSRLGPKDEGVPLYTPATGEPVRAPVTDTMTLQTTIKVANGQTLVLSSIARQAKNGKQRVLLVTPHVFAVGDAAK